jgi:lipooligosaccharide transport system permease protein
MAFVDTLPRWEMVARQRVFWATSYRRTWKGSVVSSFVLPLFYVLAMGVLLGGFVTHGAALEGAPSYLAFVAPGLAAAQAMQTATGESTWPVMGSLKWDRTYYAMTATPLAVPDIVTAHLLFMLFRVATTSAVFLLVMAPFGVFASVWGVLLSLPVLVLVGLGFAGPFFAYSATIRSESAFAIIFRLLVMPLFLFSGAFFPIANLGTIGEWVARLTPLWHGVNLSRMFTLDHVTWWLAAVNVTVLVVLTAVGWVWAVSGLEKRLVSLPPGSAPRPPRRSRR